MLPPEVSRTAPRKADVVAEQSMPHWFWERYDEKSGFLCSSSGSAPASTKA